jgi:hypothetical protein
MSIEGDSNGSESSYGPVLHAYIWMPYRYHDLEWYSGCGGKRLDILKFAIGRM